MSAEHDIYCKLQSVLIITSIALNIQFYQSSNLWINHREFPIVPICENIMEISPFTNQILIIISHVLMVIISLLSFLSLKKSRLKMEVVKVMAILLLCIILIWLILYDYSRLTPWIYQYLIIFISYLVTYSLKHISYKNNNNIHNQHLIYVYRILICSLYFHSGFCKINANHIKVISYMNQSLLQNIFEENNQFIIDTIMNIL
eukprot:76593_1